MFDIGWSELLLVAVLALVFIGPKDLPRVMRTAGRYVGKMRAMAREFQQSFEDLARESELEELRKQVAELRGEAMRPLTDMQKSVEMPNTPAAVSTKDELAGAGPTDRTLPDDLSPDMVEAIREAGEIEKFGEPAPLPGQPEVKSGTGQA
ncbi:Sec-independent protein translocase protein TatB [Parvibaculum sp.]|uniref:Sec-independent protein translocase protein TatB n=1 Tax=Parvibaculum sp. TaxID=2024848 RepID=UPI002B98DB39|nr:Sec-independent protein translocase protein TatB [Parvibaculum sp.]HUD51584.1 Sec-independent protein translocase protein TatB [Parvibaculum sp.]